MSETAPSQTRSPRSDDRATAFSQSADGSPPAVDVPQALGGRVDGDPGATDLLQRAGRLAEQLQSQYGDLDRREHALNEQLALLDQERRNVRLWVQEFEEQMLERNEQLRKGEETLNERIAECRQLVAELDENERSLVQQRAALADEKEKLRDVLGRETEVERAALEHERRLVEAERRKLTEQITESEREYRERLAAAQARLDVEQSTLRDALFEDLQREQADFDRAKTAWKAQRDEERDALAAESERIAADRAACDAELARLREEWKVELKAARDAIQSECERHDRRINEERADHERRISEETAVHERRIAEETESHEKRLAAERARQTEELRVEAARQSESLALQRQEFEQQKLTFERRTEFQRDHFTRKGEELAQLQRDVRLESQQSQTRLNCRLHVARLMQQQIACRRELLAERETSLVRESARLAEERQCFEQDRRREQARLRSERERFTDECEHHQADVRRQQDMLAVHSQNLDARRDRLDKLRQELESTHREGLENRLAIDEAWAQLAQAVGNETATARVERARAAMVQHYHQHRECLTRQQAEIDEALVELHRQRDEFRKERESFAEWIATRNESLRTREDELTEELSRLDEQLTNRRTHRDRSLRERADAERVIRGLLDQLEAAGVDVDAANQTAASASAVLQDQMLKAA